MLWSWRCASSERDKLANLFIGEAMRVIAWNMRSKHERWFTIVFIKNAPGRNMVTIGHIAVNENFAAQIAKRKLTDGAKSFLR